MKLLLCVQFFKIPYVLDCYACMFNLLHFVVVCRYKLNDCRARTKQRRECALKNEFVFHFHKIVNRFFSVRI